MVILDRSEIFSLLSFFPSNAGRTSLLFSTGLLVTFSGISAFNCGTESVTIARNNTGSAAV